MLSHHPSADIDNARLGSRCQHLAILPQRLRHKLHRQRVLAHRSHCHLAVRLRDLACELERQAVVAHRRQYDLRVVCKLIGRVLQRRAVRRHRSEDDLAVALQRRRGGMRR